MFNLDDIQVHQPDKQRHIAQVQQRMHANMRYPVETSPITTRNNETLTLTFKPVVVVEFGTISCARSRHAARSDWELLEGS